PLKMRKAILGGNRHDGDIASGAAVGTLGDAQDRLLTRAAVEETINIVGGMQLAAVYAKQVIAFHDIDSRRSQGRSERRSPILSVVNFREPIAVLLNRVVRPEQSGFREL